MRVDLYLKDPIFTYVTLSRVKIKNRLNIVIVDKDGNVTNKTTKHFLQGNI